MDLLFLGPSVLKDFNTAIEEAVEVLKKKDPDFTLGESAFETSLNQSSILASPCSTESSKLESSISRSDRRRHLSSTPASIEPKPRRSHMVATVKPNPIKINSPFETSQSVLQKEECKNNSSCSVLPPLDELGSSDYEHTPSRKRRFEGESSSVKKVPKQCEDYSVDYLGQQSNLSELECSLESPDTSNKLPNKRNDTHLVSSLNGSIDSSSNKHKSLDESQEHDIQQQAIKSVGVVTTSSSLLSAESTSSVVCDSRCPDTRNSSPFCTVSDKGSLDLGDGFVTPPSTLNRDSDSDDDLPSVNFSDNPLKCM